MAGALSRLTMTPADIRAARGRLGLTQGQLAQILGMQAATVSRWESPADPLRPTPYHLALLAQFARARPRPRRHNDLAELLVTRGAVAALYALLHEAHAIIG